MFLQCGTQWDGLGHIFHNGKMYGGRDASLVSSTGAARNGIEHYKDKIVSRGVLLDLARHKGVDALRPGEAISIEDLDGCAARERSEEHTSELQSLAYLVCRLLLEKKKKKINKHIRMQR